MNLPSVSPHRLTKIVCTLGPACFALDEIRDLAKAGMNIARINVSHGERAKHTELLENIRTINAEGELQIATLFDTRGAEIRTTDVDEPIEITAGATVIFASENQKGSVQAEHSVIYVGYEGFSKDVLETNRILVDNGELSFSIQNVTDDGLVFAVADQSGGIGSRRHINLPGADVDLPSITEKDWADIRFAAQEGVDFIALSFIRTAQEVEEVQAVIKEENSNLQIITKIETHIAVQNIEEIIEASDGIMVARGDLGAEIPFEHLPVIQAEIVQRCIEKGKSVIVATHMLESMTEHPIPTRAEVTDVAQAAMQKTDATMLSGETATGKHPTIAIQAMDSILRATETHLSKSPVACIEAHDSKEACAESAVSMADSIRADAIFVFTKTGETARRVSRYRPHTRIIAFTPNEQVQHQLLLRFGVTPLQLAFSEPEETVQAALTLAQKAGLVQKSDSIVLVSDIASKDSVVQTVQQREV